MRYVSVETIKSGLYRLDIQAFMGEVLPVIQSVVDEALEQYDEVNPDKPSVFDTAVGVDWLGLVAYFADNLEDVFKSNYDFIFPGIIEGFVVDDVSLDSDGVDTVCIHCSIDGAALRRSLKAAGIDAVKVALWEPKREDLIIERALFDLISTRTGSFYEHWYYAVADVFDNVDVLEWVRDENGDIL